MSLRRNKFYGVLTLTGQSRLTLTPPHLSRATTPNPGIVYIRTTIFLAPLHHSTAHDLEFASCLLPAATGSWVRHAVERIFSLFLREVSHSFHLCHRRDDGKEEKKILMMLSIVPLHLAFPYLGLHRFYGCGSAGLGFAPCSIGNLPHNSFESTKM